MSRIIKSIRRFFSDEDGPASVEYAVMVALIAVVVTLGARAMGTSVTEIYNGVAVEIARLIPGKGKANAKGGGSGSGTSPGMNPGGG